MERGRAGVEGCRSSHDVIDDDHVRASQPRGSRDHRESARNVASSLLWCQPRLALGRATANDDVVPDRNSPSPSDRVREQPTLIVATFTLPRAGERHRNERCPLADDIVGKRQARHPGSHSLGDARPAAVFQRVDDCERGARSDPAHRACRADERRKERAPAALVLIGGMSTAIASRQRKRLEARPADAADERLGAVGYEAVARRANRGEEEVERRSECGPSARPERAGVDHGAGCRSTDSRIAARSGAKPNQRSKARAPCSRSMVSPSAAR